MKHKITFFKSTYLLLFLTFIISSNVNAAVGIPTLTAPIDGATLVSLNPTFTWAQNINVPGTFDADETYDLVIASDQWFANIVHTQLAIATGGATSSFDMSTILPSLTVNTKYYWRVKAKRTTGGAVESPWSSTFTFTTTPAVVVPTQTFPLSGTVYTNTPTFYWFTGVVSASQFFEVWYGIAGTVVAPVDQSAVGTSGSAGGTLVPGGTVGTNTYYTVSPALTSNTNYQWWVRSTDGTNRSDWSSMASFLTSSTNGGPVTPVGTYPTLGEDQYTNNPYLYWYIVTQVTGLQFEVVYGTDNTTPSSATPVPVMTGDQQHVAFGTVGTNYFYQLSGLVSSTTYYWWVRSTDGVNYSSWSPIYTFSTTSSTGSPVKPVLTYPANSETVYFPDVSLHWYVTTIATDLKYNLEWGTNTTRAGNTGTPQTGLTSLFTTVTGLTANTMYYWWVQSTDNAGLNPSAWSDRGDFYTSATAAAVQVPVQMYPTGGITIPGTSVDLSWAYFGTPAGITYEAEWSLYPDMTLPTTITMSTPGATTQTLSGLSTGTTYYWHIRATDGVLTSAWAGPAQFSTWASSAAPIVVPLVGSPVSNAVIDTDTPELSWFLPVQSDGLTYELQYSMTGDFTDAVDIEDIATTSVSLSDVTDGEKYFWRVRSKDSNGNLSIYSAIGSFVGPKVTDIKEEVIIPEKFAVSQNYPNPFNPSTVIEYSLPEGEFVSLRVYNMLGQEVATLVNKEVEAGVHNVTWNGVDNSGSKVSTGTYIYRVVAGNNILTKKMILLK
ncbi:MAG: T9SS type A sorting domain-containing protein [Melioribacteraceae bacterium]|nr:T9SS type A sorting domain-containing protein [Melioribacteraceae bacterium]